MVTIGHAAEGRPTHLALTWDGRQLAAYLDGRPAAQQRTTDNPTWRRARNLFMGAGPDDSDHWMGRMEGVAIWGGALNPEQITAEHTRYRSLMADRNPVSRATILARRVEATPVPNPARIDPYRRALAGDVFEVVRVLEGRLEAKRIVVAHWMIMDGTKIPWPEGDTVTLTIERFEDHPQLESELLHTENEDLLLPMFFAVQPPQPAR
ncbi:MAG: LamG domain-containing protein [Phycisphaeraceae bacterium]|nr:LamG domain-containing protein [Phycisphaeraceae bacterium]